MSSMFPNGTIFSVSTGFETAVAVSGISNAMPAVATLASGTVAAGTIALINSNWAGIDGRVARASGSTAGEVTLDGIDTTDDDIYTPGTGAGAGSLLAVDTWVQLSQVTSSAKSGGEQQFYNWQYLEDRTRTQKQRPTFKNAKVLTLTLDYDPAKAWYTALEKLDEKAELIVLRAALPNGASIYYPVYPSFDADPSLTMNENMQNTATFSMAGKFTRYEA